MNTHSTTSNEGWEDIATAPRDGKRERVDLWVVRHSSSGRSYSQHRAPECYWDDERQAWRCRWRDGDGYSAIPKHFEPTHWRPLPAPPVQP